MATRRILVCSIGNPGPTYRNTRHSAGHFINEHLVEALDFPAFSTDRKYGGLVSQSFSNPTFTFFQSQSLMNISGKRVKSAWGAFLNELGPEEKEKALLVVLHDEMEKVIGQIKLKKAGQPAGHNGIASCIQELRTKDFDRLGIGIGPRPESRNSDVVSRFVLGKFTEREKQKLERDSLPKVLAMLKQLSKQT